jgi:pimeloyl-ACP methyl ester carboxylesterase
MTPKTRYARSGNLHIAYQVVGDGPFDLLYVPGWVSHVELAWEEPTHARYLERLASFSRLILFDKRGTGLSDRVPDNQLPTLEERIDDLRAVMDAAGSERAALHGFLRGRQHERAVCRHASGAHARAGHVRCVREADLESRLPVGADARGARARI